MKVTFSSNQDEVRYFAEYLSYIVPPGTSSGRAVSEDKVVLKDQD